MTLYNSSKLGKSCIYIKTLWNNFRELLEVILRKYH